MLLICDTSGATTGGRDFHKDLDIVTLLQMTAGHNMAEENHQVILLLPKSCTAKVEARGVRLGLSDLWRPPKASPPQAPEMDGDVGPRRGRRVTMAKTVTAVRAAGPPREPEDLFLVLVRLHRSHPLDQ